MIIRIGNMNYALGSVCSPLGYIEELEREYSRLGEGVGGGDIGEIERRYTVEDIREDTPLDCIQEVMRELSSPEGRVKQASLEDMNSVDLHRKLEKMKLPDHDLYTLPPEESGLPPPRQESLRVLFLTSTFRGESMEEWRDRAESKTRGLRSAKIGKGRVMYDRSASGWDQLERERHKALEEIEEKKEKKKENEDKMEEKMDEIPMEGKKEDTGNISPPYFLSLIVHDSIRMRKMTELVCRLDNTWTEIFDSIQCVCRLMEGERPFSRFILLGDHIVWEGPPSSDVE